MKILRDIFLKMKKIIGLILLSTLTLISCNTAKKSINPTIFKEGKIIFEKYTESNDDNKIAFESNLDSIIEKSFKDSTQNHSIGELSAFKNFAIEDILNKDKSEVIIDVQQDTIWRYTKQNGKFVGYSEKLQKYDGVLRFYSTSNKSIEAIHYVNLFKDIIGYNIEIDKKQRKNILGYNCFKVIIVIKEEDLELEGFFGDTIWEMYVSDKINLPVHALQNFSKLLPNFFPLELSVYSSNMKDLKEIYKAVNIEYR